MTHVWFILNLGKSRSYKTMKQNKDNSTALPAPAAPNKSQTARILAFKSSISSFIANLGALTLYPLEAIKTRLQGIIFSYTSM